MLKDVTTQPAHDGSATILIVDDEPLYRQLLELNLTLRNYAVLLAENGVAALTQAALHHPDLILLDIMLPDLNGFEVCRRMRVFTDAPIIMLTARRDEGDRVHGLDVGADDYITKPFGVEELLARIRANLRRVRISANPPKESVQVIGDLVIDRVRRHVSLAQEEIILTQTEYRLLDELARNTGFVVSMRTLEELFWGSQDVDGERAIRQVIYRLRQKLERNHQSARYIHTRSGVGYFLADPTKVNSSDA